MKGICSKGYKDTPCNCNIRTLMKDGKCPFEGLCRRSKIVYQLVCLEAGKFYIGKTQKYLKLRVKQHIADVWKLIEWELQMERGEIIPKVKKNFNVTTASKHFATLCKGCKSSNQVSQKMKSLLSPQIVWQGERIQAMKSVKTNSCKLCMVEMIEIRKSNESEPRILPEPSYRVVQPVHVQV